MPLISLLCDLISFLKLTRGFEFVNSLSSDLFASPFPLLLRVITLTRARTVTLNLPKHFNLASEILYD